MNPSISIGIISKDRPGQLRNCLKCLYKNIPIQTEIIIVDASSSKNKNDEVLSLKNEFSDFDNLKIISRKMPLGSQPLQRNECLKNMNSNYALFIDDDCYFRADTYKLFSIFLNNNRDRNILGCRINQGDIQKMDIKNLPKMSLIKWSGGSFNINSESIIEVDHLQGTFMCFDLDKLISIGGFNPILCSGYAPFEETYTILKMSKFFNQKPLINYKISVDHSIAPRLQGRSRDLGLDANNAYAYGRNGVITAKMYFGYLRLIFTIPFATIYIILGMFRPILNSRKDILIRIKSSIYLLCGIISGFAKNKEKV